MAKPHHPPSLEYLAEDSGATLLSISGLFICLDTIFLGFRFYARRLHATSTGTDDIIVLLAWLTHVGLCALAIVMVHAAGVGRHLEYNLATDPHRLVAWYKSLYALEWLYLPSCALPKISVLILFLRIFTDRASRVVTYIIMALLFINWFAYIVARSLQCRPFAYQWDKKIPGGKCINIPLLYKLSSLGNIITDVAILILPFKTVIELHASTACKLGLLFIFSAGSVGIVAACVRMATFFRVEAFEDNTWASVKLVGWSVVEPGMYLIAACSLKLRPLVRKFASRFNLRSYYGSNTGGSLQRPEDKTSINLRAMRPSAGFHRMPKGHPDDSLLSETIIDNSDVTASRG